MTDRLTVLDQALISTATAYVMVHRSVGQVMVADLGRIVAEIRRFEKSLLPEDDRSVHKRGWERINRPAHQVMLAASNLVDAWMSKDVAGRVRDAEAPLKSQLAVFFIDRAEAPCRAIGLRSSDG